MAKIVNDLNFRECILLRGVLVLLGCAIILVVVGIVIQLVTLLFIALVLIAGSFVLNILRPSERALYCYQRNR